VERLIGSIRRECLNHFVILNARHLKRTLTSYFDYYQRSRTHLALAKDCPTPRAVLGQGKIIRISYLGGLHHCYKRIAAYAPADLIVANHNQWRLRAGAAASSRAHSLAPRSFRFCLGTPSHSFIENDAVITSTAAPWLSSAASFPIKASDHTSTMRDSIE
jgi:hypothetical protein